MMWMNFWQWIIDHYIYNAAVLLFIIGFILYYFLNLKSVRRFFSKLKRFKFGAAGVEVELKDENGEKDAEQDAVLVQIKDELKKVNQRLDTHYKYIKEAAIQAGISVVWSDVGAPFVEVIRAALLNIKLGANGNLRDRLAEVIKGLGKDGVSIYKSLLNEFIKNSDGKLSEHFYETINWIDKELSKRREP